MRRCIQPGVQAEFDLLLVKLLFFVHQEFPRLEVAGFDGALGAAKFGDEMVK